MSSTRMVHVRVDEKVKEEASATLAKMGITVSDAVRMMLMRIAAEKALPFDVRVPNATTVKAMKSADKKQGKRFRSTKALFEDLGIVSAEICGIPPLANATDGARSDS